MHACDRASSRRRSMSFLNLEPKSTRASRARQAPCKYVAASYRSFSYFSRASYNSSASTRAKTARASDWIFVEASFRSLPSFNAS